MDRREFVGNIIGLSTLPLLPKESPPVNPSKSIDNPKNLPIAEFKYGECSNYKELLKNSPREKVSYQKNSIEFPKLVCYRKVLCWVSKENLIGDRCILFWGEVELLELRWEDGKDGIIRFKTLPQTQSVLANLSAFHCC